MIKQTCQNLQLFLLAETAKLFVVSKSYTKLKEYGHLLAKL